MTSAHPHGSADVIAVTGELIATQRHGALVAHTFVAPGIAELARPGQLVSLAVGDETSSIITRRTVPLRRVTPTGTFGGTIEVVIDAEGADGVRDEGLAWLAGRRVHDEVGILGPTGRGFPLPTQPVTAVVAGVGASAASLVWLITELRRAGTRVPQVIIAAPDDRRLLGVIETRRLVGNVIIVVPDGRRPESSSLEYAVQVAMDRALSESDAAVVYAAAPVPAMAAMTAAAQNRGVALQGAFDLRMPCGTGLCRACIVPVADASGEVRSVRCCTEGPVLPADRIAWQMLLEQS